MNFKNSITAVACSLFLSASSFATEYLFFCGSWFTEPIYDNKLYGCEVFSRIDIDRDKNIVWRAFGIVDDDNGKDTALVLLEASGTCRLQSDKLECTLSTPDGTTQLIVVRNDSDSIAIQNEIIPDQIFYRTEQSKRVSLLPIREQDSAEQD